MDETNVMDTTPRQDEEYKAAVDRYILQIEQMRNDMAESQSRIEQIRAETSGLLAQTRQILDRLAAS